MWSLYALKVLMAKGSVLKVKKAETFGVGYIHTSPLPLPFVETKHVRSYKR